MIKIKVLKKIEKFNIEPPDDADSKDFPDELYSQAYKEGLELVKAFYDKKIQKALKEVFEFYKNLITFDDLTRFIFYKLEEHTTLTPKIKNKLLNIFKNLYKESQKQVLKTQEFRFQAPDIEAIRFIDKMNDFYLGKFFQGDRKIRKEVSRWMKDYYLKEGNPIGRGQTGIKVFLDKFGAYLKDKSEKKARQIIDTTVNFVRNSSRVIGYQKANIKEFVWDAVNDRLTCSACRSMDGRVIKTEVAVEQLKEVMEKGLEVRPIITKPFRDATINAPVKFPPLHIHCRCGTYAHFREENVSYIIKRPPQKPLTPAQIELEKEFNNLTSDEIHYKVKAHQGAVWYRPPKDWKPKHIDNFLGKQLEKHFLEHGAEVGAKSVEEYKKMAYEIIKNPDRIYIEQMRIKSKKEQISTTYIFYKGDLKVVVSDDNLSINSFYKESMDKYIKRKEKQISELNKRLEYADWGLIRIK